MKIILLSRCSHLEGKLDLSVTDLTWWMPVHFFILFDTARSCPFVLLLVLFCLITSPLSFPSWCPPPVFLPTPMSGLSHHLACHQPFLTSRSFNILADPAAMPPDLICKQLSSWKFWKGCISGLVHPCTWSHIWGRCDRSCPTLLQPPWTVAHQAPLSMGFPRQEN